MFGPFGGNAAAGFNVRALDVMSPKNESGLVSLIGGFIGGVNTDKGEGVLVDDDVATCSRGGMDDVSTCTGREGLIGKDDGGMDDVSTCSRGGMDDVDTSDGVSLDISFTRDGYNVMSC